MLISVTAAQNYLRESEEYLRLIQEVINKIQESARSGKGECEVNSGFEAVANLISDDLKKEGYYVESIPVETKLGLPPMWKVKVTWV